MPRLRDDEPAQPFKPIVKSENATPAAKGCLFWERDRFCHIGLVEILSRKCRGFAHGSFSTILGCLWGDAQFSFLESVA